MATPEVRAGDEEFRAMLHKLVREEVRGILATEVRAVVRECLFGMAPITLLEPEDEPEPEDEAEDDEDDADETEVPEAAVAGKAPTASLAEPEAALRRRRSRRRHVIPPESHGRIYLRRVGRSVHGDLRIQVRCLKCGRERRVLLWSYIRHGCGSCASSGAAPERARQVLQANQCRLGVEMVTTILEVLRADEPSFRGTSADIAHLLDRDARTVGAAMGYLVANPEVTPRGVRVVRSIDGQWEVMRWTA